MTGVGAELVDPIDLEKVGCDDAELAGLAP
jgi:hypothetical protein